MQSTLLFDMVKINKYSVAADSCPITCMRKGNGECLLRKILIFEGCMTKILYYHVCLWLQSKSLRPIESTFGDD